jgi:hypothetical protein
MLCSWLCVGAGVDGQLGRSSKRHGELPAGVEYAMRNDIEPQEIEPAAFDDELSDEALDSLTGGTIPLCILSKT